ncbi:MAG: hypothetical protein GXY86_02685 [Firmicutes bacterium]|nr:hypothetical protein [Bacillota bacterium]
MQRRYYLFLISCLGAALIPFFSISNTMTSAAPFPGWPSCFEGKPLKQLPLTNKEREFVKGFPGQIGRFTDGTREIIIRWITQETRQLHPTIDCYKGLGYSIHPLPLYSDSRGILWGAYQVSHGKRNYLVKERIFDQADNNWSDVSAWYWSALLNKTEGPWWSMVISERFF